VRGGASSLLEGAARALTDRPADAVATAPRRWLDGIVAADAQGRRAFASAIREAAHFSGLAVAEAVAHGLPAGAQLFASNSMPIRLLDLALPVRSSALRVLCNRGASGIDGVTSTALGVAAATGRPTVLFTGDLAFLHDLTGLLLARREAIPLAIVVLDDDGGGIFSFLPVADQGEGVAFERLFRTPHGLDLARAASLFELDYAEATSAEAVGEALAAALARRRVSIVHVRVAAADDVKRFRAAIARGCAAVDASVDAAIAGDPLASGTAR
jgi:2-succinyl-5-enolpyruvyl-6-hydroxy-3-cyclohexene-1-carboxylate synthase